MILVCDVGGGTTDFSLITVIETPTGPGFRRVAVGDHLMLGGDNIDLALAHLVESKLASARLDAEQWSALRYACRAAKERLLADDDPADRWPITIAGRGSRLIGGGVRSELTRAEAIPVALDGFFPACQRDEEPGRSSKLGLQEFGLPYVNDPAITRHLATFLRRHKVAPIVGEGDSITDPNRPARPDAILYNGGALTPRVVRDRIAETVASWFPDEPDGAYRPRVLSNESLDLAVSVGAAYYGVVRRGGGIRIGGGTARAFYVGFEAGESSAQPWLCVVPRDAQEGDEIDVEGRDFDLLLDRPVAFPLASSSVRAKDRPGDFVADDPETLKPLPPLTGLMRVGRKAKSGSVPVGLSARVTEVGTVELWCRSKADDRRWRLQIQLRGPGDKSRSATSAASAVAVEELEVIEQSAIDRASEAISVAFGPSPARDAGPAKLVKALEEALEIPRDRWPPSALRALWDPLLASAPARSKSPAHELRWLNLSGYCLRPGVGFPLDELRIKALWPTFHAGVAHPKDKQNWAEWWILWRRVAAGLNRPHHEEIHRRIQPYLLPPKGGSGKKATRPKPEAHELAEIWRCAASLERLDPSSKAALGSALVGTLGTSGRSSQALWCLGRLGARDLLYGAANFVVHPATASAWADHLIRFDPANDRERSEAAFALAEVARLTGDRARDLDELLRSRAIDRLQYLGASEPQIAAVREVRPREAGEQSQALGDALPVGLRLIDFNAG